MINLKTSAYLLSLCVLIAGMIFGVLGSVIYFSPTFLKNIIGFESLRPLHVSSIVFWILITASTGVLLALKHHTGKPLSKFVLLGQLILWLLVICSVYICYVNGYFGGREYWEFPPIISILISIIWILFIYQVLTLLHKVRNWPVYYWMWCTGAFFFLFELMENYLWLIPYFREHYITDTTIQWKANGSLVGAWNQLIYGLAFYLTDQLSGHEETGKSKMAFTMYFLGLFNLMFNWGHHIYPLPTLPYVRYIGYAVSMTEWIFFIRIIHNSRKSIRLFKTFDHHLPLKFIIASEYWVFLNLGLAILMSIPAINLYTHGTHITVAHAMGTTIGINTMILMGVIAYHSKLRFSYQVNKRLSIANYSLFIFWFLLISIGIVKSIWQISPKQKPYGEIMNQLKPLFIGFTLSGIVVALSLSSIAWILIRTLLSEKHQTSSK